MGFKNLLIALFLLVIVGGGAWWFLGGSRQETQDLRPMASPVGEESEVIQEQPEVESEAIPEATESGQEESEESEIEEVVKSDEELITEAMAEKYDRDVADVDLTVSEQIGKYAKGSVKFAGEVGGGWWLAFKEDEGWVIVADGNGTVPCSAIEPYDFPAAMVPECWDEDLGLIERE